MPLSYTNPIEKDHLINAFNFNYAGSVNIFITKRYNKYMLICIGFSIDENNIIFFNPKKSNKYTFDTPYEVIKAFNDIVNLITSSMDWFTPDYFNSTEFYKNSLKGLYNVY